MKIFVRVDWQDFVTEATPAEIATVNAVLSRLRRVETMSDDPPSVTLHTDRARLFFGLRVLPDDTTIINPKTEEN